MLGGWFTISSYFFVFIFCRNKIVESKYEYSGSADTEVS